LQLAEDKTLAIETKGRKKHPAFSCRCAMPLFLVFPHLLYNSILISSAQAWLYTLFCVLRIFTRTFFVLCRQPLLYYFQIRMRQDAPRIFHSG